MPSSHSSSVMGLACAVAFQEGTASPLFAACLVFAVVVMYDASGVRLQAGRQAEVLNQIVYELPPDHPLAESRPLKEPIGHTQPQVVAGALVGVFVAYFMHHFYPTATALATYPPSCVPVHRSPPLSTPAVPCRHPAVAWRIEELQPPSERVLFHFARAGARGEQGGTQGCAQGAMDAWRVYSDAIYGGSSTATLAHATSGSAEPAGSGTELSGMGGDQGRRDMTGRDRMDGSAGMVLPPHPPTPHGWEARAMRLQQHLHFEPPSSFAVFAGSLSRRVQGKEQGEGVEGRGGRLLKGGFAGIRTIEGFPSTSSLEHLLAAAAAASARAIISLSCFSPPPNPSSPTSFHLLTLSPRRMQRAATTWSHSPHCCCTVSTSLFSPPPIRLGCAHFHPPTLPLPGACSVPPRPGAICLTTPARACCALRGEWGGQQAARRTHGRLRTEGWVGGPAGSEENTWQAFLPSPRGRWGVVQVRGEGVKSGVDSSCQLPPYMEGRVVGGGGGRERGGRGEYISSGGGEMQMHARRIPLSSYRLTWKGRVVGGGGGRERGREGGGGSGGGGMQMNARRVVGMGISVNVSTPPMHSPHLSATAPLTHPPHIAAATPGGVTAAAGGDFCPDAADAESDAFPVHGEGAFRLEVVWVKAVRDGA
ncbi:unnamed protein product [Closterium sp. Naga37s-1]|nr:unnamed protein product [Closterium sp. Naga37s-1]